MNMIWRVITSISNEDKSHVSLPAHNGFVSIMVPKINDYNSVQSAMAGFEPFPISFFSCRSFRYKISGNKWCYPMNCPAASRGVSRYDKFYLNAANCGELNPANFAVSTPHSLPAP
jgi:hypothetical protein